jgi:hypothetical protein
MLTPSLLKVIPVLRRNAFVERKIHHGEEPVADGGVVGDLDRAFASRH